MKHRFKPARAAYRWRTEHIAVPIRVSKRRLSQIPDLDLEAQERVLKALRKSLLDDLYRPVN